MEDSTWQSMLNHLTNLVQSTGELSDFKSLPSNAERVKFCNDNTLVSSQLNNWMKYNTHLKSNQKNSELANRYRTDGNKAYRRGNFADALEMYNKALLYSPKEEVALVYGNRSAVLFRKLLLEECISDIDMSLKFEYPEEKVWKLHKRKGEALMKLGKILESKDCFEKALKRIEEDSGLLKEKVEVVDLLDIANVIDANVNERESLLVFEEARFRPLNGFSKHVTSASKAISLSENSIEGRHFVANETVKSGSIVISEKPYAAVLLPHWFESHCQHCFMKIKFFIPCHQCTKVRYCSSNCQSESWSSYHYLECGKFDVLEKVGVAHLALRIILVSDMNKLSLFFCGENVASREMKGCNKDGVYENSYESLYHLVSHSEDIPEEDMFQYTIAGLLLLNILIENKFFTTDVTDYTKYQVGGLMLLHIQQIVCNAHAVTSIESTSEVSSNIYEQDQVRIATAIYPTSSLLNHSCDPSIINTFYKGRLLVKAIKNIGEGEHIFSCYGPHFRRMDFAERQDILKGQYFFQCKCDHCSKGYEAMEEFDCFSCPNCLEGFHVNDTVCHHCNFTVASLADNYKERAVKATGEFLCALKLMKSNSFLSALTKLLDSCSIQEKIYFRFHSSIGKTFDAIAKCHAALGNYPKSIQYVKASIHLIEIHYGCKSVEVANEILKLIDLYFQVIQGFIDNKEYRKIEEFIPKTLELVERGIHLVNLNKAPNCSELEELICKKEALLKLKCMNVTK